MTAMTYFILLDRLVRKLDDWVWQTDYSKFNWNDSWRFLCIAGFCCNLKQKMRVPRKVVLCTRYDFSSSLDHFHCLQNITTAIFRWSFLYLETFGICAERIVFLMGASATRCTFWYVALFLSAIFLEACILTIGDLRKLNLVATGTLLRMLHSCISFS